MHFKYSILALAIAGLMGCTSTMAPDVAGNIRNSLQQAGLKDVTVTQDRDKGVVTLGGHVANQADKDRAEQIVKPLASGQVVANQVTVQPATTGTASRTANPDQDKGMQNSVAAAFSQAGIHGIRYSMNNGVVTLSGMATAATRAKAERVAAGVPDVKHVVNRIAVKRQAAKAESDEECDSATVVDIQPCDDCE